MNETAILESSTVASQSVQIEKVKGSKALKQFIDFPHDLYAGDPNYVPELFMAQEALLNRKTVGSSRVDLQACKLEYSIVSPK